MDDLVPPVVMTKPARGREMQTTTIPTDMFDTMRMVSAKRTLRGEDLTPELQKPKEGTAEQYHEGYVDGKLYLVPDSNLEAMKDIINFKMRPRTSTRYRHQTSYEISDYDHFRGKLDGLFAKLDTIQDMHSVLSDETVDEPKEVLSEHTSEVDTIVTEESKSTSEESSERSESEESEKKSKTDESEEKSENEEVKEETKPKPVEHVEEQSDVYYLRFLISGHFKKDQKPIYIIQEYNGEPDLFKNQKIDFFSKQKDGNVDVCISGKFYNENMLEELNGKPVALNTKPEKIKIEMEKCKIYDDHFKEIYNMKNNDISLKGEFIKSRTTNRVTPFLTLGVKRRSKEKSPKSPNYGGNNQYAYNFNAVPTTVLVYEPKYIHNPFSRDVENNKSEGTDESLAENSLPATNSTMTEPYSETDSSVTKKISQPTFFGNFSLSDEGVSIFGDQNAKKPINRLTTLPNQNFSEQIDTKLARSGEADPAALKDSNTNNTPNTKKYLGEGFLKMIKGSHVFKSIFGNKMSEKTMNNTKKTHPTNSKSTVNVKTKQSYSKIKK